MAISQEQQKRGLEHLKQIRRKYFSESSEAAEWWDNLTPEWRGVVLHAAAVTSGKRMVVTPLSNLHIYTQRNTRMRKAEFVEDRKQFENKYLRNEGYAVEVPELYAAIDESAVTIGKVSEPVEG